ncbi:MAG: hypothetical protein ABI867_09365 [Kofleriaceae bacterium]
MSIRGIVVALWLFAPPAFAAPPRDFTTETRAVRAVAACGEPAPTGYDKVTIAQHCRELAVLISRWRTNWFVKAQPFLAEHVVKPPTTVVYPFGGGDVVTMLTVYPDATDYTTLSLEGIGDPRPLAALAGKPAKLAANLAKLRTVLVANLGWAWNTTIQLSKDSSETGVGIPGILSILLVALDAHGYEPIEARYFELAGDGSLNYVTQERVDAFDAAQTKAPPKRSKDTHDLQQGIFTNIEVTFRKKGDANAPKKVFRHIAADLSDEGLEKHAGALAYVDKKRDIAAMTKAASYLFWKPGFEKIRNVFLARMRIMVSDDTGIPPRFAKPAGFTQEVFGTYHGTFFKWADQIIAKEMIELWKTATTKTIAFRFGYYDNLRNPHLMITRK